MTANKMMEQAMAWKNTNKMASRVATALLKSDENEFTISTALGVPETWANEVFTAAREILREQADTSITWTPTAPHSNDYFVEVWAWEPEV